MKKIDIEKWDRKTPKLPENFFDEMQKKVLAETIYKREPKRFKLNWVWSSAAAVAVIFGIAFFTKTAESVKKMQKVVQNEIEKKEEDIIIPQKEEIAKVRKEEEVVVYQPIKENTNILNKNLVLDKVEKQAKVDQREKQTKKEMEKILSVMSEEDFRELAGNYEQDVYLELY